MSVIAQPRDPSRVRPESGPILHVFFFRCFGHVEARFPLYWFDSVAVAVEVELAVTKEGNKRKKIYRRLTLCETFPLISKLERCVVDIGDFRGLNLAQPFFLNFVCLVKPIPLCVPYFSFFLLLKITTPL